MDVVKEKLIFYANTVEKYIFNCFPSEDIAQGEVVKAMKYSASAGGKRIRPALTLEFCNLCSGSWEQAISFAAAVEMIHTYSLIHDDLPCMDNDDMRRGKPSNHVQFGESTALLAGDALLNFAFETALSDDGRLPAELRLKAAQVLANYAGVYGMIGGQVIDLESEGKAINEQRLQQIHLLKTAALMKAAGESGCIAGGGDSDICKASRIYCENIGMAFQIVDDVLDITSSADVLGKPVGSDMENEKTTFVSLYGVDKSMAIAREYTANAKESLHIFHGDTILYALADTLLNRKK